MLRLFKLVSFALFSVALLGCLPKSVEQDMCVSDKSLYKAADMRTVDKELFKHALACANSERVETALISLGRIGGEQAANLIAPLLSSTNSDVRAKAAFALGVSAQPAMLAKLQQALQQEQEPKVQRELTLAIGNLASDQSWAILSEVIASSDSSEAVRGALQGLGILTIFNRAKITDKSLLKVGKVFEHLNQPQTELEASFLLARSNIINSDQIDGLLKIYPKLGNEAKAQLIRAMAKVNHKGLNELLLQESENINIGIRTSSLAGLGKHLNQFPVGFAQLQKQSYSNDVISQLSAMEPLKNYMYPLRVKSHLSSKSSWVKSQALLKFIERNHELNAMQSLAQGWLDSKEPNLERAAIAYFVKINDKEQLQTLVKHTSAIISNGAKGALGIQENTNNQPLPTPQVLAKLAKHLVLKTTKGAIRIKLFADTPYTSANFIRLANEGFYDNTYFHRVIPNFVAQGGSTNGDGSGTVDYMIREELSMRSHRAGTIGMATAGKDTGGGQFFINLAPNLHLDSNYTVFGEVLEGMDVAIALEQNDQILTIEVVNK